MYSVHGNNLLTWKQSTHPRQIFLVVRLHLLGTKKSLIHNHEHALVYGSEEMQCFPESHPFHLLEYHIAASQLEQIDIHRDFECIHIILCESWLFLYRSLVICWDKNWYKICVHTSVNMYRSTKNCSGFIASTTSVNFIVDICTIVLTKKWREV